MKRPTHLQTSSPGDADALARVRRPVLAGVATLLCALAAIPAVAQADTDPYAASRLRMVERQADQIQDQDVLEALKRVPRHRFVPRHLEAEAYGDRPVALSPGRTLPAAKLSAQMIELLELDGDDKVLEIGTGTGYDAALLSQLAKKVYTIEIDPEVGELARRTLRDLGYENVEVRIGDGAFGWPEKAPFDAILVTAAPGKVPEELFEQLAVGGRMVVAVGGTIIQELQVITKSADGLEKRPINPVRIDPMKDSRRRR